MSAVQTSASATATPIPTRSAVSVAVITRQYGPYNAMPMRWTPKATVSFIGL
jgi:hypothetical protein